ncbi:hypothetical protein EQG68_02225 [Flavobacterium piscinae]|uniref:Uncharacterized protein n=1 Tax=Flavobacterium piscinae TaxID=2506424 RepID=A0A4Q1KX45_9FLAO|nr:hypothetical protein [Flavobacterium piscinae]RXR34747.1 hypothetical protein EQG68_02225 [Flavobacterium piscinae]
MKYLKILNTVAIGIPIVLAFLGIFDEGMLMYALVSTMVTGFIQVIVGILFWIKEWKNYLIISYLVGVILFFMGISLTKYDSFWIMPPIFCVFIYHYLFTLKKIKLCLLLSQTG